jgi:predicted Ser/Thr protein kinase
VADLAFAFDDDLRHGRSPDWEWYLSQCGDAKQCIKLLACMIRCEQGQAGWNPERIKERIHVYGGENLPKDWLVGLARDLYTDQITSGNDPPLSAFEMFDFPADELDLREEGEPFFLGYLVSGRYRLEQRLGKGRFGIVYRGRDLVGDEPVAVKVSRGGSAAGIAQAKVLLRQEAASIGHLLHAGIPKLITVVEESEIALCMVMELVEGETLREVIVSGPIEPARAASIASSVAEIVDFAHSQGFIHRDLSPGNILVTHAGQPYLVDFGLALSEESRFAAENRPAGTPFFIAPENLDAKTDLIDGRADVWSLGAILYALLAGPSHATGDPREARFRAVLMGGGRLPFPESVPDELRTICAKCLSSDPSARYDTAGDLAIELRRFLDTSPGPLESDVRIDVVAWRVGFALGSAERFHSVVRGLYAQATSTRNVAIARSTLRHELEAMEGFNEAALLAESIPVALPSFLWECLRCTSACSHDEAEVWAGMSWVPGLIEDVERSLKEAFVACQPKLEERSQRVGALFELGVLAALGSTDSDVPQMLKTLAARAGVSIELISSLATAMGAGSDRVRLGREIARLNRLVERTLLYGEVRGNESMT